MDNNEILLKTLQKENELLLKKIEKDKEVYSKQVEEIKNTSQKYSDMYNMEIEKNKWLSEEKTRLENQLNSILYSRSYKITQKIKKILGR